MLKYKIIFFSIIFFKMKVNDEIIEWLNYFANSFKVQSINNKIDIKIAKNLLNKENYGNFDIKINQKKGNKNTKNIGRKILNMKNIQDNNKEKSTNKKLPVAQKKNNEVFNNIPKSKKESQLKSKNINNGTLIKNNINEADNIKNNKEINSNKENSDVKNKTKNKSPNKYKELEEKKILENNIISNNLNNDIKNNNQNKNNKIKELVKKKNKLDNISKTNNHNPIINKENEKRNKTLSPIEIIESNNIIKENNEDKNTILRNKKNTSPQQINQQDKNRKSLEKTNINSYEYLDKNNNKNINKVNKEKKPEKEKKIENISNEKESKLNSNRKNSKNLFIKSNDNNNNNINQSEKKKLNNNTQINKLREKKSENLNTKSINKTESETNPNLIIDTKVSQENDLIYENNNQNSPNQKKSFVKTNILNNYNKNYKPKLNQYTQNKNKEQIIEYPKRRILHKKHKSHKKIKINGLEYPIGPFNQKGNEASFIHDKQNIFIDMTSLKDQSENSIEKWKEYFYNRNPDKYNFQYPIYDYRELLFSDEPTYSNYQNSRPKTPKGTSRVIYISKSISEKHLKDNKNMTERILNNKNNIQRNLDFKNLQMNKYDKDEGFHKRNLTDYNKIHLVKEEEEKTNSLNNNSNNNNININNDDLEGNFTFGKDNNLMNIITNDIKEEKNENINSNINENENINEINKNSNITFGNKIQNLTFGTGNTFTIKVNQGEGTNNNILEINPKDKNESN